MLGQPPPVINTNILVEAKKEYTKHICNLLAPIIIEGLQTIYGNCKEECEKNQDPELLRNFQQVLKQIPKWNQDIIDHEYDNIIENPECEILDDLIKAVFITNIKILSSVSNINRIKKVQIEIPSSKRFIHKCYIESAREIYKDPFLFTHDVSAVEQHRNLKEIYKCVSGAIEESIRLLLPVKQILQEYLGEGTTEEEISSIQTQIGAGNTDATTTENGTVSIVPPPTGISHLPQPQSQSQSQSPSHSQQVSMQQNVTAQMPMSDDDPTPSPPRSPKKLFPSPRKSPVSPSPLMRILAGVSAKQQHQQHQQHQQPDSEEDGTEIEGVRNAIKDLSREASSRSVDIDIRPLSVARDTRDEESDDESYDEYDRDRRRKNESYSDSETLSRSLSQSRSPSPLKQFRVDPSRRFQSVPSVTESQSVNNKQSVQNDIKAIVLGQVRRDRTHGYNNNKDIEPNRYRNKSIQFTVEKEKKNHRHHQHRNDRHEHRRHEDRGFVGDRNESVINFDRSKKRNLFFDDVEEEFR